LIDWRVSVGFEVVSLINLCSNVCLNMCLTGDFTMVKRITISDEVYGKLLTIKGKNESFSELFDRLVESTSPVETLKKLRGRAEFSNKEAMLTELYNRRAEKRS